MRQGIYREGPRQVAQARNLIANVSPAPSSIQQTIEKWSDQDIIIDGSITLVRSKFSAHRYFIVLANACSCEKAHCPHMAKAAAYRAEHAVEEPMLPQPTPSQEKKMTPVDSTEKVLEQDGTLLVQSRRFLGWAYTVTWNDAQARYLCSCGNPVCKEHVNAAREYVNAKYGHGDVERSA